MDICISIQNKVARVEVGTTETVCDNGNYNVLFLFDGEWNEYTEKTARFRAENGSYTDVVFSGNECTMPKMEDTRITEVGVFTENIASTSAVLPTQLSILSGIGMPTDPTPDVYAQITDKLNKLSAATLLDPPFVVTVSGTAAEPQFNKTYAEVLAALNSKQPVYLYFDSKLWPVEVSAPTSDSVFLTGCAISDQGYLSLINAQMYENGMNYISTLERYMFVTGFPVMPADAKNAFYLKSPNNTIYKVSVSDAGTLTATEV